MNPSTARTHSQHWKRAWTQTPAGLQSLQGVGAAAEPATGQGDRRNWTYLLKRGFTYGADWQIGASGQLTVGKALPDLPGVYALIVDEDIVYIGVTARTLSKRMADYARGPKAQRTSHRVHHLLKTALGGGRVSRVLYAMPEHTDWNGLPVQTAPGLEQGLIQHIKPIWNLQGA